MSVQQRPLSTIDQQNGSARCIRACLSPRGLLSEYQSIHARKNDPAPVGFRLGTQVRTLFKTVSSSHFRGGSSKWTHTYTPIFFPQQEQTKLKKSGTNDTDRRDTNTISSIVFFPFNLLSIPTPASPHIRLMIMHTRNYDALRAAGCLRISYQFNGLNGRHRKNCGDGDAMG